PIRLTRMKTNYTHVGYLDVDAIQAPKISQSKIQQNRSEHEILRTYFHWQKESTN
ncbi:hypothetical protein AAA799E16_02002, partial [Marine Group I thaumarchaeote SCGC AAA799-E16]